MRRGDPSPIAKATEQLPAEKLYATINEWLRDVVLPTFEKMKAEIQKAVDKVQDKIERGEVIGQSDFDALEEAWISAHGHMDNIWGVGLDPMLAMSLDSKHHGIKHKIDERYEAYKGALQRYVLNGGDKPSYVPAEISLQELTVTPDNLLNSTSDIGDQLSTAVFMTKFGLEKKGIKIHFSKNPEELLVLQNTGMTGESLREILRNAGDAMPNGGDIYVAVAANDDKAKIEIKNTGMGISEENLSRILDRGFTTKDGGTGQGLALIKLYIEGVLGGQFKIESEGEGKGSTVTITLPLAKPEE